jgi:ribosomal protein S6
VLVTFEAEPAAQAELDRTLNLADEVLRYKTTVLPRRSAKGRKREEASKDEAAPRPDEQPEASPAAVGGATPQGE